MKPGHDLVQSQGKHSNGTNLFQKIFKQTKIITDQEHDQCQNEDAFKASIAQHRVPAHSHVHITRRVKNREILLQISEVTVANIETLHQRKDG